MLGEKSHQQSTEKKPENKFSSAPSKDSAKQEAGKILTSNPVDKILNKSEEMTVEELNKGSSFYSDYKIWVFIAVVVIFSVAMSLNTLLLKRVDLKFFTVVDKTVELINRGGLIVNEILINYSEKPFVITIGEFKTIEEAKDEAVRLLPSLKQVNIELLDNGYYVFVVDKLSSKKHAYEFAKELKDKNISPVKVRYLRKSKFITPE